jgi:hypothetical protein
VGWPPLDVGGLFSLLHDWGSSRCGQPRLGSPRVLMVAHHSV